MPACPVCARPLAPHAPSGPCPQCVLAAALDPPPPTVFDPVSPAPDAPGRRVGEYELLGELGHGGMGVVDRARQPSLQRVVALKVILAGRHTRERDRRRFQAEAEAAARLDHPNIVPIYEVGEDDEGRPFLSMKLIEGGSLAARISNLQSPVSHREAAALLAKISCALHHPHQRGMLHRDLKPGNILLDAAGEPFVTDFGLAKLVVPPSGGPANREPAEAGTPNALALSGEIFGTPGYMAPEVARAGARAATVAADVYARARSSTRCSADARPSSLTRRWRPSAKRRKRSRCRRASFVAADVRRL